MTCALCPTVHRCLTAEGPDEADLLLVGEAPGKEETKKGRLFIGKVGQELDFQYLPLAGLHRKQVRVINAISCLPASSGHKLDMDRGQDRALLDSCASAHLYPEIERKPWKALILLGNVACRAVLGDGFDLELNHGIPHQTPWGIPAFPMYHPALGIHEPKKMLYIRTDWYRLSRWLKGKLDIPVDTHPNPEYVEVTRASQIDLDPDLPIGMDTESTRKREPFCVTYSQHPGTGFLIRQSQTGLVDAFRSALTRCRGELVLHNYLYDWTVLEAMGLYLPAQQVRDTMQMVFHFGHWPQGLKALAYRELGMTMQDFEDVVGPHSKEMVLGYYWKAREIDWPKPDSEVIIQPDGTMKMKQPQGMNTKLKRFFTDFTKNPEKDVFQAWDNWASSHAQIEEKLGPWPGMCISHAPFDEVLAYACRDADATLRLYLLLRAMRHKVRRFSQEHWREGVTI